MHKLNKSCLTTPLGFPWLLVEFLIVFTTMSAAFNANVKCPLLQCMYVSKVRRFDNFIDDEIFHVRARFIHSYLQNSKVE